MPNDNDRLPGFHKFDELAVLLEEFAEYSLIECVQAYLVANKNGQFGNTEKIKKHYEEKCRESLNPLLPLATFAIAYDNDGNWIAFLISSGPTTARSKIYSGRNCDWQTRLIDPTLELYDIEPTDDLREHIRLTL